MHRRSASRARRRLARAHEGPAPIAAFPPHWLTRSLLNGNILSPERPPAGKFGTLGQSNSPLRVSVHPLLRPFKCCFLSKKASCRVAPLLTSAPTRVWLRPGEAAHRTKQGCPPAVCEASAGVTSFPNGPPVCRRNSMSSSSQISRAVRQALVLGAVAAAGSLPAVAQEQAAKPVEVETITVTGSRIPQP